MAPGTPVEVRSMEYGVCRGVIVCEPVSWTRAGLAPLADGQVWVRLDDMDAGQAMGLPLECLYRVA